MSLYADYMAEIEARKTQGLHPKPIEGAALVGELIAQIKDTGNEHRDASLNFFIYNTLPGTTSAAGIKAQFLEVTSRRKPPAFLKHKYSCTRRIRAGLRPPIRQVMRSPKTSLKATPMQNSSRACRRSRKKFNSSHMLRLKAIFLRI